MAGPAPDGRRDAAAAPPVLAVVVDTEEEFDWTRPFSRDSTATRSIPAQAAAQEVFADVGAVPTYVVDYPVAATPEAARFLRGLREAGVADIGAHLHPWVNPPHEEAVGGAYNSYHGNLPPALERAKLRALTAAIADAFGERPTVFKAGRYGLGPDTLGFLREEGYRVDCSVVPHTSFRADHGPTYVGAPDQPFWLDPDRALLEVPLTVGFLGAAAGLGPRLRGLFDSAAFGRLKGRAVLARAGLVERSQVTPEGVPAAEQRRLLRAMAAAGRRVFCLTYHSPSLAPGNTPYVRDAADLRAFLGALREVLGFFRDELGGAFRSVAEIRRMAEEGGLGAVPFAGLALERRPPPAA